MQKKKGFNINTYVAELISIVGRQHVSYDYRFASAVIPIRGENGEFRYKIKLLINSNTGYCRVFLVEPKIKKINGEPPPHIYPSEKFWNEERQEYHQVQLCLYLLNSGEFDNSYKLIETVIAWAIKWTEFYELWLLCGIWYGGGQHPSSK